MADMQAKGETPEILFWVGCAGAFDDRYQNVTKAFIKILEHVGIKYAVLGPGSISFSKEFGLAITLLPNLNGIVISLAGYNEVKTRF